MFSFIYQFQCKRYNEICLLGFSHFNDNNNILIYDPNLRWNFGMILEPLWHIQKLTQNARYSFLFTILIMWWKQYAISVCRAKESILSWSRKSNKKRKTNTKIVSFDMTFCATVHIDFFYETKHRMMMRSQASNVMAVICVYKLKQEPLTFTFIRSKRAPNAFVSTSQICWMIYWNSAKKTKTKREHIYFERKLRRMKIK